MATLNPIQETPNPVPSGQLGTITLTFTLDPGTPDLTANIGVYKDGTLVASSPSITLKGVPAETTPPTVTVGTTNVGYEIRVDHGVLASLGGNQFSIAHG